MDEGNTSRIFLAPMVIEARNLTGPGPAGVAVRAQEQAVPIYRQMREMLFPSVRPTVANGRAPAKLDPLNLKPGEWVEVRPLEEINETLDGAQKYKGLYFMPEMAKFCGGKFKVFKKAATIKLESTGEVRRLKKPAVFLEGVYCDGEYHEGCDRACFHFWREAWLKRIPEQGDQDGPSVSLVGT